MNDQKRYALYMEFELIAADTIRESATHGESPKQSGNEVWIETYDGPFLALSNDCNELRIIGGRLVVIGE